MDVSVRLETLDIEASRASQPMCGWDSNIDIIITTGGDSRRQRYTTCTTVRSLEGAEKPRDLKYVLEAITVCCAYLLKLSVTVSSLTVSIAFRCEREGKIGLGTSAMVSLGVCREILSRVAEQNGLRLQQLASPDFRRSLSEKLAHLAVIRAQHGGSGYDVIACSRGVAMVFSQSGEYLEEMHDLAAAELSKLDIEKLHSSIPMPISTVTRESGELPEISLSLRPPRITIQGPTTETSIRSLVPGYQMLPEFSKLNQSGKHLIGLFLGLLHATLDPPMPDISIPRHAKFEDLRHAVLRHREMQRDFQHVAGVEIEPDEVRAELDEIALDSKKVAMTVGAGGYDFFLVVSATGPESGKSLSDMSVAL